jgi:hypothetical protein
VWGLVLEEPIVVGGVDVAPPAVGVVAGLLRQHGDVLGLEVDRPLVVRHDGRFFSALHDASLERFVADGTTRKFR